MRPRLGAAAAHLDAQDMLPAVVHLLAMLLLVPPIAAAPEPSGPPSSRDPARVASAPPLVAPVWPGSVTGVWPLAPRPKVVAGFDPPLTVYGPGHRGVDLAGSLGQVVHAAAAGRVTYAGSVGGRGVVVVDHGATRTTYEPVHATVRVGTVVPAGAPIGTLQAFGSHCWPDICLHWGLLQRRLGGDVYLDPLSLVGAGPVRLLPLLGGAVAGSAASPGASPAAGPGWMFWRDRSDLSGQTHRGSPRSRPAGVPAGTPAAGGPW